MLLRLLLTPVLLLFCDAASASTTSCRRKHGHGQASAQPWSRSTLRPIPLNDCMDTGNGCRRAFTIRIYHRIVVLDDGTSQFFLVSSDVCILSTVQYDRVSELLNRRYGINPLTFWWSDDPHPLRAGNQRTGNRLSCSCRNVSRCRSTRLIRACMSGSSSKGSSKPGSKLAPARLGAGWGFSQANINRRAVLDGKAYLGMNPDGAVDRRIGLLRIDKQDGTPLVCIANYPIHGTVLGGKNLLVSGDVQGTTSEYFEQTTGIPLLFINGAQGNLAPIYSGYPGDPTRGLGFFKSILGDKIIDAYRKTAATADRVKLSPGSIVVETPRKPGLGWPSALGKYTRTNQRGGEPGEASHSLPEDQ